MEISNSAIDQAVKIKNGKTLNLDQLNHFVADLILSEVSDSQVNASASRIAREHYDYELLKLNRMKNELASKLNRMNKPVSPLDI